MLKNYIKITFRNLRKNPGYSFINIGGLTIGIACCLFIFQYVAFEYSFDDFNENASDLYRVVRTTLQNENEPSTSTTFGHAMGPALAQEVPEVVHYARLHPEYNNAFVSNPVQPDNAFEEQQVYYADPAFFQMFSYPIVSGNPALALMEPETIMLSESTARRYFGNEDPMGKVLDVRGWISGTYRVNGIFKDVPTNSHLQFDILLPMVGLLQRSNYSSNGWAQMNFITYVQLRADANLSDIEQKFTDVLTRHDPREVYVDVQPLRDIHLNKDISAPKAIMSSYRTVYFFSIIGLITLLIALVNYVNLTTARALNRAREVGVRKAIGAQKGQLIMQFLCDSALTILVAAILAVVLADLLMPLVNKLAGTNLTHVIWSRPDFWAIFLTIFCIATLLAGLYPAFILSSFKPVTVLKGKTRTSSAAGVWLRRGLVVFQFTAAIILLVGTAIVYTQLNYMRNMDLGINLEQILTITSPRVLPEGTNKAEVIATFTQELRRLPTVRQTATSHTVPGKGFAFGGPIWKATADVSTAVPGAGNFIDTSFVSLYGLELVAGEGFANISMPIPEGEPTPILANKTAIQALGFDTPEEALGQELNNIGGEAGGRLVGVLEDFNWSSAHQQHQNAFFIPSLGNNLISIKINTEDLSQTLGTIKEIYKQHFPGNPFRYAFADDQFDQQYKNDERFARLFSIFASLAIIIACLGLFGLVTFTAERRTKEIGIRKVLGASVINIAGLMSKDFIILVFTGFIIAVPIAWYVMGQWLQNFAYRIEIGPGIFLMAGSAAILIALATVSWQSVKAALMNPVNSLRSES